MKTLSEALSEELKEVVKEYGFLTLDDMLLIVHERETNEPIYERVITLADIATARHS